MATVRSTWRSASILLDGVLPAAEWAGAGMMLIPAGVLMVKNDAANLYVALDMIGDTGNDPSTNDYYWFVIDMDNNGAVTPNRDALFSPWPGQPNRLGRWLMAGPNTTWPASTSQVLASKTHIGFGPSPNSATNHRRWEMRLSLSELGITVDPAGPNPTVKFGLRVVSSTPAFTFDFPANPLSNFAGFHQIILATDADAIYPAGTAGVVMGGVGLIPATKIGADGYATITDPYFVMPDEAAFSGTLNLIGNTATLPGLWGAGARKYKVMHRSGNTVAAVNAAAWAPIRQSWANFRWNGATYVWESFGPDVNDMYPLVDPVVDYSIKALLFQWDTTGAPNNLHQFKVDFFTAANVAVASPAQTLTLRLDNKLPDVSLVNILHNGSPVAACAIETMTDAADGVQLVFTVNDPEGDLYSYSLGAEYGSGLSAVIASDSYANPANRNPAHNWPGVTNRTAPSPGEWAPPVTCAYLFRISAWARTTNGYSFPISWVSDYKTVTLIKPGPKITLKTPEVKEALPYGFEAPDKIASEGVEPEKLGADSLKKD